MAVPKPSLWYVRSIDVALLAPHVTTQSAVVTAVVPGWTVPNSVIPAVDGAHPAAPTVVALGMVADTTVLDDAPGASCVDASATTTAMSSVEHARRRARSDREIVDLGGMFVYRHEVVCP